VTRSSVRHHADAESLREGELGPSFGKFPEQFAVC